MKRNKAVKIIIFILLGIVINVAGNRLAQALNLPVYLDSFGTILVAAVSGYIPGIIAGFLTNVFNSFFNSEMLYFGGNSILIAVLCALLASRGYFKKIYKVIFVILILAGTSGVLSSLTAWSLENLAAMEQTSNFVRESANLLGDWAMNYLRTDLFRELCDKSIAVFLAFLAFHLIPEKILTELSYSPYREICTEPELLPSENKRKIQHTIHTKIAVCMLISFLIVAIVATWVGYYVYKTSTINSHIRMADGLTALVVDAIDAEKADEFLKKGREAEGYSETEAALYRIKEAYTDAKYLYVYRVTENGCEVIFDLDSEELKGAEPGSLVEFDPAFEPYRESLLAGKNVEPVISESEYGYLLTVYKPVYNQAGECVCYACVDFPMDMIRNFGFRFVLRLLWIMSGFLTFIVVMVLALINRFMIAPINVIARMTESFSYQTLKDRMENHRKIESLKINTKDEIENLHRVLLGSTDESLKNLKKQAEQMETLTAIANTYVNVYELDLVKNKITEIVANGLSFKDVEHNPEQPLQEVINKALEMTTDELFLDLVLIFADLSTFERRLKKRNVLTLEVMNKKQKWSRCRIIVSGRNEEGKVTRVLWLTEDIDEEIRAHEQLIESTENLHQAEQLVEVMKGRVEALDEIAFKDALTGLGNKAAYDERVKPFDAAISAGNEANLDFAVMMIDLNFLKKVNDTYGHEHGNVYLKNCAEMVSRIYGEENSYRFGGDEFVAVLTGEKANESEALTEIFNNEIKALADDPGKEPWEKVSAAVGIAHFIHGEDKNTETVFKRADAKMYENKIAMKAQRTD